MPDPVRLPEGVTLYPPGTRNAWRIVWRTPAGQRRNAWRKHYNDAFELGQHVAQQLHDAPAAAAEQQPHSRLGNMLDAYCEDGGSIRTRNMRRQLHRLLPRWLADTPVDDITRRQVDDALADMDTTDRQRHACYTFIRSAFQWGIDRDHAARQPLPAWKGSRPRKTTRQGQSKAYVDPAEIPSTRAVEDLAQAALELDGWRRAAQVRASAYQGLRLGEVVAVASDMVDLDAGALYVERQHLNDDDDGNQPHLHAPKGGKLRVTIIPGFMDDTYAALTGEAAGRQTPPHPCPKGCRDAAAVRGAVPLWPHTRRRIWPPRSTLYERFKLWRREAGWPHDDGDGWRWSWHSLRHHFCTWALANPDGPRINGVPSGLGLEVADVSHFAGHSSPSFTFQAYCHTREGAVDRARQASST